MPVYEEREIEQVNENSINKLYNDKLKEMLNLERNPIGIQLYYTEEEFNESELDDVTNKMAYCVFIEKASRSGFSAKTKLNNHYCDGATTVLGLENPNTRISSGREFYSYGLYKTKGVAQKIWRELPAFPSRGINLQGIGIAPLEKYNSEPDVVVVIGNPLVMMRLIQANSYMTGERLSLDVSAMSAMCSEVTAVPYLSGEINISAFCPSTRTLAKWGESEMVAGIPYGKLDMILKGVEEVTKVK